MATRTILLVEDNPDDIALAEAVFANLCVAHELVVAEDGESALARVLPRAEAVGPALPDLILLDLKLPGIGGLEVLRRIRAEASAVVPIVVLTSSVEERDVLASYRLGANSYVRKPVDFDEFIRAAEQITRYWLQLNEAAPAELSHAEDT